MNNITSKFAVSSFNIFHLILKPSLHYPVLKCASHFPLYIKWDGIFLR